LLTQNEEFYMVKKSCWYSFAATQSCFATTQSDSAATQNGFAATQRSLQGPKKMSN
jgi:hypothetical protein